VDIWGLTACHRLKTYYILGWLTANVTRGQWNEGSAPSFNYALTFHLQVSKNARNS